MNDERERLARVALADMTEPGDPRVTGLVDELGAVTVHEALEAERDLRGVLTDGAARRERQDPAGVLERAARQGIRYVIPSDDEWPTSLDDLMTVAPINDRGGPPLGLWVRGPLRLDQVDAAVAVVGSRSATSYGADVAGDIAAVVARSGALVMSGAAYGIDHAAHRGALAGGGETIAVLACGVDRAYPAQHKTLLDSLAAEGAVVSEALPGWSPTRVRFLARNRLIAAMTRGTVVVEAAVRSGALNTANWAGRLNRSVMGVPGPVTSAPSQGVHQLIRSGAATLVTSGDEVLEMVGSAGLHLVESPRGPERPRDRLSVRDQQVLDAVPVAAGARADSIARTAGLGLVEVRSALTRMARNGLVEHTDAGWRLAGLARTH